jgi:hypothetical protein
VLSSPLIADDDINEITKNLEQQYKVLSEALYKHYINEHKSRFTRSDDINDLYQKVLKSSEAKNPIDSVAHILNNLKTILDNLDNTQILYFIEKLLDHNELNTAITLLAAAEQKADNFNLSKIYFLFAKYYFQREEWIACAQHLSSALTNNTLPELDRDYAFILSGIILQKNKRHRVASNYYEKVPKDSEYYNYAQLNNALVNIRQGWWTDAHIIINGIIDSKEQKKRENKNKPNDELTNRLYVVLGYSMLRNEFYRYARESFRNVNLNSQYSNQALLGIGLSAIGQEDFIGALNAFTRLKEETIANIYIDESHLLSAFTYDKLRQSMTASTAYSEAIEYFQSRIENINNKIEAIQAGNIKTFKNIVNQAISIEIQGQDLTKEYPQSLLNEFRDLQALQEKIQNPKHLTDITSLKNQYLDTFKKIANNKLRNDIDHINSYLNQSRFGLAQVYDKK